MAEHWKHLSASRANGPANLLGDIAADGIGFCEAETLAGWQARQEDNGGRQGWVLLPGHRPEAEFRGFNADRFLPIAQGGPPDQATVSYYKEEVAFIADMDRKKRWAIKKGAGLGAQRHEQINSRRTGRPSHPGDACVWETDTSPGCG